MRFRLYPTPAQELSLLGHCAHARFVWNLALEQASWYRPQWGPTPGYVAQSAQLTEARAECEWLAAGSFTVQQQALRDFAQARKNWWAGTHRRPTWRKEGVHEGFRVVAVRAGHVRRLNRHWGDVTVPKVGQVRFRWSRAGVEAKRRESQATFRCVACGHSEHADTNAARNILAAGRAVTARGGEMSSPSNREPQPRSLQAA